jgi:hypothetical protein
LYNIQVWHRNQISVNPLSHFSCRMYVLTRSFFNTEWDAVCMDRFCFADMETRAEKIFVLLWRPMQKTSLYYFVLVIVRNQHILHFVARSSWDCPGFVYSYYTLCLIFCSMLLHSNCILFFCLWIFCWDIFQMKAFIVIFLMPLTKAILFVAKPCSLNIKKCPFWVF